VIFSNVHRGLKSRASAEKFPGGEQWKIQDRELALISLPLFYQWCVRGALGMHPGLTSKERCIKSPA